MKSAGMMSSSQAALRRKKHFASAFTLVELLLALSVSGMIGTAVLVMLSGTVSAAQKQHDTREATVTRQIAIARLSSLTRCTAMVLATGDSSMVLWKGDINANSKPDLSELRRIEWDADTKEVWLSESPVAMDEANDVTCNLGDNFTSITAAAAGTSVFPTKVILSHIQSWTLTLDQPSPHDARLLRLDVQLTHDSGDDTATIISSLRASGL